VVEVNGDGGVLAVVPEGLGAGEVEEDVAFGGLAGVDSGIAVEGWGALGVGEFFEGGKGEGEVGEVGLFDGAGGEGEAAGVGGGDEGGVEVLEEEGELEVVGDAEGYEDVEVVLGVVAVEDDGVVFEDDVGGVEGGAGDEDVGGGVRSVVEDGDRGGGEDGERDEDGEQVVAACGLGEGDVGHEFEDSSARWEGKRLG